MKVKKGRKEEERYNNNEETAAQEISHDATAFLETINARE